MTSIKVKSTNKGIYSVQYLKNDEYTSPWAFHSTFYSKTNLGEKGTGAPTGFRCCCQGAGYRGTPEGTVQPVRVVAHTSCPSSTGHSLELCQTSAGSGSWGRSPALQYWEALVYHLSKNFSMYSSARLESLH